MNNTLSFFKISARAFSLACVALLVSGIGPAHAEDSWPSRAVRIIVPYGPGGAVDVATRKMAQKLSEQTGQSFVVENKPGATGTIGLTQVARSAPDGYTLVANDTTHSLLPHIFKTLPFDHAQDLVPVTAYLFAPMTLAVNANSPYKRLDDLLQQAKKEPDTITYGSGGPGTIPHFAAESLGLTAGVKFMHVPFKGAAEATQAILAQTIDMQFASTTGVIGNVQGGKLRLLAISGDQRTAALPDVPTFTESGLQGFGVINWTGIWAPKGTPDSVLQRLQKEVATAMADPDMQEFAQKMGAQPRHVDTADFTQMLKGSSEMWGVVASKTGFESR